MNPDRRVPLDTNTLSYLLDDTSGFHQTARRALEPLEAPLIASPLAVSEILVGAHRQGGPPQARRVREAIESVPGLTLVPLTTDGAQLAASTRARSRLALPDALHLATARSQRAEVFLTNDAAFKRLDFGVDVLLLSDLP